MCKEQRASGGGEAPWRKKGNTVCEAGSALVSHTDFL